MARRLLKFAVSGLVTSTFVLGVVALFATTPAHAVIRHCICPDVYAPVTCSNGRTYSNGCVASCAGATDCHPSGDI